MEGQKEKDKGKKGEHQIIITVIIRRGRRRK